MVRKLYVSKLENENYMCNLDTSSYIIRVCEGMLSYKPAFNTELINYLGIRIKLSISQNKQCSGRMDISCQERVSNKR